MHCGRRCRVDRVSACSAFSHAPSSNSNGSQSWSDDELFTITISRSALVVTSGSATVRAGRAGERSPRASGSAISNGRRGDSDDSRKLECKLVKISVSLRARGFRHGSWRLDSQRSGGGGKGCARLRSRASDRLRRHWATCRRLLCDRYNYQAGVFRTALSRARLAVVGGPLCCRDGRRKGSRRDACPRRGLRGHRRSIRARLFRLFRGCPCTLRMLSLRRSWGWHVLVLAPERRFRRRVMGVVLGTA